ncbi:hypothetical protein [Arthrobacter oryzae]|uniref:hypothetical protein n=1 Tax=Arthrobacter oryzae TaxID=409290 RepID=UPI002866A89B|nr:hypothetical protein [Arthrobacter oryzae]MDR6505734.1 hypothetical protein [Arthrobacter oryzae]
MLLRGTAKSGEQGVAQHGADDHGFGHVFAAATGFNLVKVGLGNQKGGGGV